MACECDWINAQKGSCDARGVRVADETHGKPVRQDLEPAMSWVLDKQWGCFWFICQMDQLSGNGGAGLLAQLGPAKLLYPLMPPFSLAYRFK